MPQVLNKHRIKGGNALGAVYIGRPSPWGNPFQIGLGGSSSLLPLTVWQSIQKALSILVNAAFVFHMLTWIWIMGKPITVFDIDGTLSDFSHRARYLEETPIPWSLFFGDMFDDQPIAHMCELFWALRAFGSGAIGILTSRPMEYQGVTMAWLVTHKLVPDLLRMRATGDHREDFEVKDAMRLGLIADGFNVVRAFDDRLPVVEMWRKAGVPCLHVADGGPF